MKILFKKNGSLGRSKGCLALPVELNAKIIDLIHDGVVIYVHTNFDENKDKQNYFDFLDLLDTYFLIEIKKLTNIEIFENYIKM